MTRGSLSRRSVRALYGESLRLSASRIDKFASCRFAYFCQYGLRAKPYEPAAFRPPEIGTFMHYVLEKTAREVKRRGGFAAVDDKTLRELMQATPMPDRKTDPLGWVQMANSLKKQAEEAVLPMLYEI